jgi:hypothetical protein
MPGPGAWRRWQNGAAKGKTSPPQARQKTFAKGIDQRQSRDGHSRSSE